MSTVSLMTSLLTEDCSKFLLTKSFFSEYILPLSEQVVVTGLVMRIYIAGAI